MQNQRNLMIQTWLIDQKPQIWENLGPICQNSEKYFSWTNRWTSNRTNEQTAVNLQNCRVFHGVSHTVPTAGAVGCVSGFELMLEEGPEIAPCADRVGVLPHASLGWEAPKTTCRSTPNVPHPAHFVAERLKRPDMDTQCAKMPF